MKSKINKVLSFFKKAIKNPVFGYLFTRYFTYFIQFVSSIFIAVKLGPYYFGIWGFILLIINYYGIFDLGIPNSMNVLVIKNKDDNNKIKKIVSSSFLLTTLLNLMVVGICVLNLYYDFEIIKKYGLKELFYVISLIGIIVNYNNLIMHLYRINNKLNYISFYQSIVPLLVFISLFCFNDKTLLYALIGCYLIGYMASSIAFIKGGQISTIRFIDKFYFKEILKKGLYLFLYNVCFYLILVSLRSFISSYYTINEFGMFSFAFSLANSILLFVQAVSFLLYPKFISKLNNDNPSESKRVLDKIRDTYIPVSYLFIFLGLSFFPILLSFIPKYENTFKTLGLCALSIALYCNSFGYSTFLIANNKEKINGYISLTALIINLTFCYIFIFELDLTYEYIVLATMISYGTFSLLCSYFGNKYLDVKKPFKEAIRDNFNFKILFPFLVAIVMVVLDLKMVIFLPFLLFMILNWKSLQEIFVLGKRLLTDSNFLKL